MSQVQIRKKRSRRNPSIGTYRIRARINHENCILEVDDYGTFKQMFKKYGNKDFMYFCADVLNEQGDFSHRLDSDLEDSNRLESSLQAYGSHKSWIQPGLRIGGKKVILVRDAE